MLKSSGGMTVTPLRTAAMTSPTVPPQPKANNRISNFSVASLLADTRPKSPSSVGGGLENTDLLISATNLSTSPDRRLAHSPLSSTSPAHHLAALSHHHQLQQHHLHLQQQQQQQQLAQAQLAESKGHNLISNHLTKVDRLAHPARTVSHHSSEQQNGQEIESDIEYDSNQEDEEEDSMVDIEDCNDNDSRSSQSPKHMRRSPNSQQGQNQGPVPIRPTPFSALAAAAVAWGGVPWPGARQMPPFGPPGLFPGQGFGPGGMSGKHH